VSSVTLMVGQIAFTTLRSPLIRAAVALLFAIPAAVAGYHAALGLAHIAIPTEGWRDAIAVAGAIIVAATASVRMAFFSPLHAGRGIAAGLTSPGPLTLQTKEGSTRASLVQEGVSGRSLIPTLDCRGPYSASTMASSERTRHNPGRRYCC
jgi:hypothetical protein